MKTVSVLALLLLLAACSAEQKSSETAPAGGTAATAQVKAYPLDWCIVSGEKLGSMGDPVIKTYQGREVKFCCKHCVEEFEKNQSAFIAKIDSAAAGQIQQPAAEGHGG